LELKCEINGCLAKFNVVVPAARVTEEYEKRLKIVMKSAELPGFRVGRAPRNLVDIYFGDKIKQKIIQDIVVEAYTEGVKQENIYPLTSPSIVDLQYEKGKDMCFSMLFEIRPKIEFDNYRNLSLTKTVEEVTEEQIDAELKLLQDKFAKLVDVKNDRGIKEGDVVIVDFEYSVNGRKNKKENDIIEVGGRSFLPEFEQKLLGAKRGESLKFTLSIPKDFINPEMAGQDVIFNVIIKEQKEKQLPPLDDEFAKDVGEYETLEELKQAIRKECIEASEQNAIKELKKNIQDILVERCDFPLPNVLVKEEVEYLCWKLTYDMSLQGINLPERLKCKDMDMDELREKLTPYAEKKVKILLILDHIAKKENITVTEEEYKNWVLNNFRATPELIRECLNNEERKESIMADMIIDKTLNFLLDVADIKYS
jgi:trigger factor